MVSGRLSGWGTARSTSYRRLEGSGRVRECAPSSTCTFPSALEAGGGVVHIRATRAKPNPRHCPWPLPAPGHSHVLQAVCGAQHPLLRHQEASAHVLAVHLHGRHVGPRVGHGLAAAQDPPTRLRRCGWAGGREDFRDSCSPALSPPPPPPRPLQPPWVPSWRSQSYREECWKRDYRDWQGLGQIPCLHTALNSFNLNIRKMGCPSPFLLRCQFSPEVFGFSL